MGGRNAAAGTATPAWDGPGARYPKIIMAGGCNGAVVSAGLALAFEDGVFHVTVVDAAGHVLLTLGAFPEEEVVAVWRRLGAASGLPLMVAGPDGELEPAYPQIGRLRLGSGRDRRRLGVLSGRRPRFLVRRKPSRLPRRPLVHRESEIATGRGR